jgi:hypothetical protein
MMRGESAVRCEPARLAATGLFLAVFIPFFLQGQRSGDRPVHDGGLCGWSTGLRHYIEDTGP